MRVHHDARAADAMDRRVDALRRQLDHALAFERPARLVEHDQVAHARLRPVPAEGQDQVAIVPARHGDGEVIVDAFFELVQHRKAVRRGKVDFCLLDRVSSQRLHGKDGHDAGDSSPGTLTGQYLAESESHPLLRSAAATPLMLRWMARTVRSSESPAR